MAATQLAVRELSLGEIGAAAAVLGRGMRDNPLHVRVFGTDPDRREAALEHMFDAVLRLQMPKGTVLGALSSDVLIGVCAMVQPGRCQPRLFEKMRLVPVLLAHNSLASMLHLLKWISCWARYDPNDVHWHLGPVGVERHWQGKGVGSALVREFCARVDAARGAAYLETDKRENVAFYERFGFHVRAEDVVLNVHNWFMTREVRA